MKRAVALLVLALIGPGPAAAQGAVRYRAVRLDRAIAHVLEVPASYRVTPALAPIRRTVRGWLQDEEAIAALNGGYFNHQDGVSASYVVVDGTTRSDPHDNRLLVTNPRLRPYLPRIFERTEYQRLMGPDGPTRRLSGHFAPLPPGHRLTDALQAGPRLLPELGLESEGFVAYGPPDASGRRPLVRDGIGAFGRAARSALGLRPDGTMLLVAVLGLDGGGLTIPELRDLMAAEGCTEAMNLDGGSSTSMAHRVGDRVHEYAPPEGGAKVRSVLVVLPPR